MNDIRNVSGCKGFCTCPQSNDGKGRFLTILAIVLSLMSWGLSIGVHATCNFVQTKSNENQDKSITYGMWTKQNVIQTDGSLNWNNYQCEEYTWQETIQFDTLWNAASGLAYTAGIIGFVFTILLIGTTCVYFRPSFYYVAATFYILAAILDFCTVIARNSDICDALWPVPLPDVGDGTVGVPERTCAFGTGAGLAVGAGIGYLVTAAIVACIPRCKTGSADSIAIEASEAAEATKKVHDEKESENSDAANDVIWKDDEPQKECADEEQGSEDDVQQEQAQPDLRGFWPLLASNLLFLNGAAFYMWLAVLDLQWARQVKKFHDAETIDKVLWWWFRPWYEWYNPDDYVFQTRFHWVSKYQTVYFVAAASFMIEGFLDFFLTPGITGLCFVFAGSFGLLSAWTAERDPSLSIIFNLLSAHMYLIEALGLVLYRMDFSAHPRLKRSVRFNDACFAVATAIDVALSYTSLLNVYKMSLANLGTASAALWLFCGAFYVGATLYAKKIGYFK